MLDPNSQISFTNKTAQKFAPLFYCKITDIIFARESETQIWLRALVIN